MVATKHSIQSTLDNAAPTPKMNHKETRQGWRHEGSPNEPPDTRHRIRAAPHRGFDFTAPGSRGIPMDTPEKKSRLPRPKPRLRRCSPPLSLPQKPPCTSSHRKHQRDQILQDGALKRGTALKTTTPPDLVAGSGLSPEGLDPGVEAVKIPDNASKEDSDAHRRRRRRPVSTGQAFTRCSHSHAAGRGRPVPPLDRAPPTQRARHCCVGPPANLLDDGPAETRSGPAPRIQPRQSHPAPTSGNGAPPPAGSAPPGPPATDLRPAAVSFRPPVLQSSRTGQRKLPILRCQGRIRGVQACPQGRRAKTTGCRPPDLHRRPTRRTHRTPRPAAPSPRLHPARRPAPPLP